MGDLLSSAPSLGEIHASITKFYCGTPTRLVSTGETAWKIVRASDGKHLDGVTVRRVGKRYRFEMVPMENPPCPAT